MDLVFEGLPEQQDYLELTRQNILNGIRQGMWEGMQQLAGDLVSKFHSRTGVLADAILRSPRLLEGENYIAGEVSTQSAHGRNLGLWLEYGIQDPSTLNTDKAKFYQFTSADAGSVWTHGHGAFQVAPHPFFNSTFQEDYPTILEIIQARIVEATDGA